MPTISNVSKPQPLRYRDEYTIGIVCALKNETIALQSAFDYFFLKEDEKVETAAGDGNTYSFGTMERYHVVLAHLGDMGGIEATAVARDMRRSFPNIKLCLVVGICGIVPRILDEETFLGDVVISTHLKQYDRGKEYPSGFRSTNMLGAASVQLTRAFSFLATPQPMRHLRELMKQHLTDLNHHEDMKSFHHPGYRLDVLYEPDYVHEHRNQSCDTCHTGKYCEVAVKTNCDDLACSAQKLVSRDRILRLDEITEAMREAADVAHRQALDESFHATILPKVYLGTVASGNKVMKNGTMRDQVAVEHEVVAFEMEGAGVWNTFPTIVIKAGCDYADSHKNKKFQKYAAMTAAACAKAFLGQLQMGLPKNVELGPVPEPGELSTSPLFERKQVS